MSGKLQHAIHSMEFARSSITDALHAAKDNRHKDRLRAMVFDSFMLQQDIEKLHKENNDPSPA